MKKTLRILTALVLTASLAAACGDDDGDTSQESAGGGGADGGEETMTVGVIGPTSGPAASWGIALDNAAELYGNDLREAGGIDVNGTTYFIDHRTYDHQGEPGEAATVTERLIFEDDVDYIIGNAIGATCEAAQAITEAEGVFFAFVCWGRANLSEDKPLSFRTLVGPDEAAPLLYGWMADERPELESVAVISPADQSGEDTADAIVDAAEANGLEVVANEGFERGTQEYSSLLTRIVSREPDVIDLAGSSAGDGALILRQLEELGYDGQLAWTAMLDPQPVVETAGADAVEGLLAIVAWNLESEQSPEPLRDFAQRYQEKFGEPATLVSAAQYATFQVVQQAMEKTGSVDPTEVANAIAEIGTFEDTVLGTVRIAGEDTYGVKRQFVYPLVVTQFEGGESREVARVEP